MDEGWLCCNFIILAASVQCISERGDKSFTSYIELFISLLKIWENKLFIQVFSSRQTNKQTKQPETKTQTSNKKHSWKAVMIYHEENKTLIAVAVVDMLYNWKTWKNSFPSCNRYMKSTNDCWLHSS